MRFEQALSRPMDPSRGLGAISGAATYAGDSAGSSGHPARDHMATLANANSTVSALAVFLRPL